MLQSPAQSTLLEANPEPGLREEIDNEFAQQLADKKAAMSEEEIDALVQATADYNAWTTQDAEDAAQYVEQLNVADLQNLSEEVTEAERLSGILGRLCNRSGMIVSAIGSAEGIDTVHDAAVALADTLTEESREQVDYTADLEALELSNSIAIEIPNAVSFNGYVIATGEDTFRADGRDEVIYGTIQSILWYPYFRFTVGAYAFRGRVEENYAFYTTYRDPGIAATYDYKECQAPMECRPSAPSLSIVPYTNTTRYSQFMFNRNQQISR